MDLLPTTSGKLFYVIRNAADEQQSHEEVERDIQYIPAITGTHTNYIKQNERDKVHINH